MDADEISRKVLGHLKDLQPKGAKFKEMKTALGLDAKSLSKNLFYLEENRLVKLATSVEADSTFPVIFMVKLTDDGGKLASDKKGLLERFPGRPAVKVAVEP